MKKIIFGTGGIFLCYLIISISVTGTHGDPKEICQPRNVSYNIEDTKQCDKYHQCTKAGKLLPRFCDDGFVFSAEIHNCDYPHNVNCSGREILQDPQSIGDEKCPRMNGFYPFPAEESCQRFIHCLEGRGYEKTCAEGVIFDPSLATCIQPDLSRRKDCAAKEVLNYTCPNYGKKFARLRFGDHDRLPHTTNCRKFFICLADGKPRVGGCPLGKVFNPKIGMCDSPKQVPQCKDYYGKQDLAKLAKLAELGEEGIVQDEGEEIESKETNEEDNGDVHENTVSGKQSTDTTANKGKKFNHSKRDGQFQSVAPVATSGNQAASQTGSSQKEEVESEDEDSDNEGFDSDN